LYQPLIIESKKTFIVVENESAYFMNLENGAIVNRITLEAGKYFINTPVSLAGKYIFPTNSGIIAYSDSHVPERVIQQSEDQQKNGEKRRRLVNIYFLRLY
jgi:hypothetical protein